MINGKTPFPLILDLGILNVLCGSALFVKGIVVENIIGNTFSILGRSISHSDYRLKTSMNSTIFTLSPCKLVRQPT